MPCARLAAMTVKQGRGQGPLCVQGCNISRLGCSSCFPAVKLSSSPKHNNAISLKTNISAASHDAY